MNGALGVGPLVDGLCARDAPPASESQSDENQPSGYLSHAGGSHFATEQSRRIVMLAPLYEAPGTLSTSKLATGILHSLHRCSSSTGLIAGETMITNNAEEEQR